QPQAHAVRRGTVHGQSMRGDGFDAQRPMCRHLMPAAGGRLQRRHDPDGAKASHCRLQRRQPLGIDPIVVRQQQPHASRFP
ncbi:hypothetical protein RZS08_03200, partial [Arthrospira platensis SPKY1]|nr:hypothetical protein [Arthrospira platensis SPKY1]